MKIQSSGSKPLVTLPPQSAPRPSAPSVARASQPASGFDRFEAARDVSRLSPAGGPPVASTAVAVRAGSPDVRRALDTSVGQLGSGGRTAFDNVNQSEAAVRRNAARNEPWTMERISRDPDAFLRNVTQLDGNARTRGDHTACGPTALMMGMIAARPESIREFATKLIGANGRPTAAAEALLSAPRAPQTLAALNAIRSGTFSARDVTTLSDQLLGRNPDTSGNQLMALRATITRLGVNVPRIELQQFGAPDGSMGHWRAMVNGTQYNPWPNADGEAGITREAPLRAGMADGDGFVCREKLFTDGYRATRHIYSVHDMMGQDRTVTSDPPLFRVDYQYDGDFMARTNVDSRRAQELTNDGVTPEGIDRLFQRNVGLSYWPEE